MQIPHHLQAPQLTGQANRISEAFGAAVWLRTQLRRHRHFALKNLETRLLEPIRQGQYVLARTGRTGSATRWPCCCTPTQRLVPSQYLHDPSAALPASDWCSGDRLWLIDWVSPFGQSWPLRHPMLALFERQTARSLMRHPRASATRRRTWRGEGCTQDAAHAWWRERPIRELSGNNGVVAGCNALGADRSSRTHAPRLRIHLIPRAMAQCKAR